MAIIASIYPKKLSESQRLWLGELKYQTCINDSQKNTDILNADVRNL